MGILISFKYVSRDELEKLLKKSCMISEFILDRIDEMFGKDEEYILFDIEGCGKNCDYCYCLLPLPLKALC